MLELNDKSIFMESGLVPVSGHWCVVCEITQVQLFARLTLDVEDMNSEMPRKPLLIAFYVDHEPEGRLRELMRYCRVGGTIFLLDARPHHFLDGQWGIRVENLSTVKVRTGARSLSLITPSCRKETHP